MWKVKRMNTARIVVLADAVGAGGIAACVASGSDTSISCRPAAQRRVAHLPISQTDFNLEAAANQRDLHRPAKRAEEASHGSGEQVRSPGNHVTAGGDGLRNKATPTRLKGRSI
jgi:hypothetical protein